MGFYRSAGSDEEDDEGEASTEDEAFEEAPIERQRRRSERWLELIPRLQEHFGGDPRAWLQLRLWEFRMYVRMYGPLRAEQNLRLASAVAVGTGSAKNGQQVHSEWAKQAMTAAEKRRRADPRQMLMSLAAMGLPVQLEGRAAEEFGGAVHAPAGDGEEEVTGDG